MAGIQAFKIANFKNDVLTSIMRDVEHIVQTNLTTESESGIIAPFSASLNAFVDALRTTNETFYDRIREADASVDKAYSVMRAQANCFVDHPETSKSAAGQAVCDVFDRYPNPTKLSYAEEYGIMEKLIRDLDEVSPDTLALISLDAWLPELKSRVSAFNELSHTKNETKAATDTSAVKRARTALEEAYKTLVTQINALLVLFPDDAHIKLSHELNTLIDTRRATEKARKTSKSNTAAGAQPEAL